MCRLAFASAGYVRGMSLDDLEHLFQDLETEMGGHGNGYAYRVPGKPRLAWRKGIELTPRACAYGWLQGVMQGASELLFHTRIASAGNICDGLCHPFVHGLTGLAHNGHDSRYVYTNSTASDSFHIAWELANNMLAASDLHTLRGTFVGWSHGIPFIQAASWSDCELTYRADGWLCASRIPLWLADVDAIHSACGYAWVGTRKGAMLIDAPPVPEWSMSDAYAAYESTRLAQKYLPPPSGQGYYHFSEQSAHVSDNAIMRMTDDEYNDYLDRRIIERGKK